MKRLHYLSDSGEDNGFAKGKLACCELVWMEITAERARWFCYVYVGER